MVEWLKRWLGWIIGPFIGELLFKWLSEHPEYGEKILYYLIRLIPFTFSRKKRKIIEKAKQKIKYECDILFVMGRGIRNVALAKTVASKLSEETFCEQINGASKFNFCPEEGRKIAGIAYAFKRKV